MADTPAQPSVGAGGGRELSLDEDLRDFQIERYGYYSRARSVQLAAPRTDHGQRSGDLSDMALIYGAHYPVMTAERWAARDSRTLEEFLGRLPPEQQLDGILAWGIEIGYDHEATNRLHSAPVQLAVSKHDEIVKDTRTASEPEDWELPNESDGISEKEEKLRSAAFLERMDRVTERNAIHPLHVRFCVAHQCLKAGLLSVLYVAHGPDRRLFKMVIPAGYSDRDAPDLRPGVILVHDRSTENVWAFRNENEFETALGQDLHLYEAIKKEYEYEPEKLFGLIYKPIPVGAPPEYQREFIYRDWTHTGTSSYRTPLELLKEASGTNIPGIARNWRPGSPDALPFSLKADEVISKLSSIWESNKIIGVLRHEHRSARPRT